MLNSCANYTKFTDIVIHLLPGLLFLMGYFFQLWLLFLFSVNASLAHWGTAKLRTFRCEFIVDACVIVSLNWYLVDIFIVLSISVKTAATQKPKKCKSRRSNLKLMLQNLPASQLQAERNGDFQMWRKKLKDLRQATSMCLNVSEFNSKLSGSTNGSMNNPFLPTASVYSHNWPFTLHVDSVIFFTSLNSELFWKVITTLGSFRGQQLLVSIPTGFSSLTQESTVKLHLSA